MSSGSIGSHVQSVLGGGEVATIIPNNCGSAPMILVLSWVYSKQPIFGLTQEWLRQLYCGVHDKLHISSADWWDLLPPLA